MSSVYTYNSACRCVWCQNDGTVPVGTPDNGHAFGYDDPHIPPTTTRPGRRTARIVALLSWYDETPSWLARCVESLTKIPVDHLIALDGSYAHYPDPQPQSDPEQAAAIDQAAAAAGITCEIHRPVAVWPTEIEKRNHLFTVAELGTSPDDWYLIMDSDEFITDAPQGVRAQLEQTFFDVATVELIEPGHPNGTIVFPTHPKFFRAIPGLRAVNDHFTYTTPDGRRLWGDAKRDRLEPRHLTGVRVEHHNQLRHSTRRDAALEYYRTRDDLGLEDLPAERSLTA